MGILPISDRRARLALILALLGVPSVGVTLPAAVWLGLGALRTRRLASGAEPAMGFLALVISGMGALFVEQGLLRLFQVGASDVAWAGVAWGIALAAAVVVLVASSLRIHPERYGAQLATRAGLVASLGGGTAMLVQLLAVIRS